MVGLQFPTHNHDCIVSPTIPSPSEDDTPNECRFNAGPASQGWASTSDGVSKAMVKQRALCFWVNNPSLRSACEAGSSQVMLVTSPG